MLLEQYRRPYGVVTLRACLQESGEPQGIEVTRLAVVEK